MAYAKAIELFATETIGQAKDLHEGGRDCGLSCSASDRYVEGAVIG